jgi:hypothetical protein
MCEPVNRILSIIAGVRRQALLCLSTSSAERGPAGAAGELQGHTPEGVGTKKCVGIPIRDRHPLPSSRQMGEKMCEIEDVGIGHWIHHIRHRGVVAASRVALVPAQRLHEVVLALAGQARNVLGNGRRISSPAAPF